MTAGRFGGGYQTRWSVLLHCHSSEILTVDGLQMDARSSYLASFDQW